VLLLAAGAGAWPLSHGGPSGNRLAAGAGSFPRWQALAFALEAPLRWLVALPPRRLAGVDAAGTLLVWELGGGALRLAARFGEAGSGDGPPAVASIGGDRRVLALVARDGRLAVWDEGGLRSYDVGAPLSPLAGPVPVPRPGRRWDDLLAVAADGAVVLIGGLSAAPRVVARLDLRALPDARITQADLDGDGTPEAVVLTDPTDRHAHGVLGDRLEATAVSVLEPAPDRLSLRGRLVAGPTAVFEDLLPILAPLEGRGRAAILLARSTPEHGAAAVALAWRDGRLAVLAESPPAGQGQRWLHLVGVGDLSGDGAPELAAVRTPHLGGVLSVFARRGPHFVAVASAAGHASHALGSRNLDQALLADLDGNGRLEIVLPRQRRQALAALELSGHRLVERWSLELRGPLESNLVAADLDGDGLLDLAAADRSALHLFLSLR
jgi:hypothetical protein